MEGAGPRTSQDLTYRAVEVVDDSTSITLVILLAALLVAAPGAQGPALPKSPLVERVGDTGFIQLQARSFATLTDKQKELAYWLSQASIAIDPIIYDQLSRWGLRQKRLLEGIVAHPRRRAAGDVRQGARVRAPLLGQPRESQRDDGAEVPAGVHVRGVAGRGAEGAGRRRVRVRLRRPCRRSPRRTPSRRSSTS